MDALSETGAALATWPATSAPGSPCEATAGWKNPVIALCPWRADLHASRRVSILCLLARVSIPNEAANLRRSFRRMVAVISAANATGFPATLPDADVATAAWLELEELSSPTCALAICIGSGSREADGTARLELAELAPSKLGQLGSPACAIEICVCGGGIATLELAEPGSCASGRERLQKQRIYNQALRTVGKRKAFEALNLSTHRQTISKAPKKGRHEVFLGEIPL